jgi:HPt (histidine-containing phosphotransfer) domain-containing protein
MEPIRSQYEDDPDMMEIVLEFAAELPERANEIERVLAAGDFDQLKTLAHQLKGAGGGYGFPKITEVAGELEHSLKEGTRGEPIKAHCAALTAVLRAVVAGKGD